MRKKDFKTRALAVALTAAVALSSTACGSKSTADASSAATSQSESTDSSSSESTAATPAPTATPVPTATPAPAESTAETDDKSAQASQNGQNTNSGSTNSSDKQNNATSGSKGNTTSSGKTTVKAPAQAAAPVPTATPKPITYTYVVRKHPASCTTAGYDEHICQEWGGMNYNDNYVAPTGHDWGAGVVTKQATYFEKGSITYTCKTCGETKVEETPELDKTYHIKEVVAPTCTSEGYTIYECNEVPGLTYKGEYTAKLPHSWDDGVVTKAATIYEKGVKTFTCTVCGETRTEDIPVLDKTWHKGETVAPTCTEQGYTVYICDQDETLTEKRDYTDALGHDYDDGVITTEPTCTTEGVKTYTCKRDGATKTETVDALGHDWDAGKVTKAATCTEDGVFTFSCTRCDATDTATIPATGHKWDDGTITVEPTCETDGEKTYKCTNDGCTETKTEKVDALGHDWGDGEVTTPATCTADGVLTYICKHDSSHTKTEAIPALGHAFAETGTVTKAATCEEDGIMTYPCTHDGCTEAKTEVIPALGHDWNDGEVTTPATCTEDGVKTYTCKNDARHTKTETIAKLGHKWDAGKVTIEPTYESDGEMTFTCENDSTHTYTETIPAKKYTFTVTVVDPTCTEQGYTLHTCNENAEKSYKDNYTNALGHDYKEVTTPATCKDAGKVENVCQRCGDTQLVKDLPVTEDHQWNDGVVTKAATCTEAGEKLYTCTVCDKTKTETIAAIGHDWEEKTTPATCKDTGSVDRTCKTCGVTEHVKDLPVTNEHIWDAGTVTKEANCTDKGETTYSCTVCGATKVEEDIAALGHDFHGGNCNRCGVSEDYDPEHFRQTIFTQTNEFRAENDRAPLTYLSQYQTVADLRAKEQATSYGHTRPNGEPYYTAFEELGYGDRLAAGLNGENAGRMQGTWFFEDWAVNGWSVSPGHRQAMLADAADGIVVGCYYDPVTQYYYAIQMFFSSELANQYKNSPASQSADPADAVAVQTVEPVTEQPVVTAAPAETSEQPTDKTEDEPSTVSTDEKPATSETAETEKESE